MSSAAERTRAKDVKRQDRRIRVLALRRKGLTFDEIAQETGWPLATCWRDYKAAMDGLKKYEIRDADDLRRVEISKLDALEAALAKGIANGDPEAVNSARRIVQLRAELNGLLEPAAKARTVNVGAIFVDMRKGGGAMAELSAGNDDLLALVAAAVNRPGDVGARARAFVQEAAIDVSAVTLDDATRADAEHADPLAEADDDE